MSAAPPPLFHWSKECEAKWLLAHEYADEKNTVGTLCALVTLCVALQKAQPPSVVGSGGEIATKLIPFIAQRLRNCDSPIHLLARDAESSLLPVLDARGTVQFREMPCRLYVQLEPFAQHNAIVVRDWQTPEKHAEALSRCGF